jgi:predicted PurR-regulated permease PerM
VTSPTREPARPGVLREFLATWAIAPLVFFFLLRDTGEIKRGLLTMVPNRLFEPTLRVLADLDAAVGDYVRGVSLECGFLGVTVAILLTVVGVPLQWAITVGIVSGASNVIPYAGTAVAMLSGLTYALLADDVRPLLPWVNPGNLALWVVVAVVLAELIKSVIYEPIVFGGRVKLHPIVMGIGVVGGATLFGPVGMFLAIPTITIVKAFVSSSARQIKAYGLA